MGAPKTKGTNEQKEAEDVPNAYEWMQFGLF